MLCTSNLKTNKVNSSLPHTKNPQPVPHQHNQKHRTDRNLQSKKKVYINFVLNYYRHETADIYCVIRVKSALR